VGTIGYLGVLPGGAPPPGGAQPLAAAPPEGARQGCPAGPGQLPLVAVPGIGQWLAVESGQGPDAAGRARHSMRLRGGQQPFPPGGHVPRGLTDQQCDQIRALYGTMSERKIAEQVGAQRMQVRRYITGEKLKGKD
jgi:hypothetical protein